jgi:hypothetical protein
MMKRVLPIIYLLLIPLALFGEAQGSFFSSAVETTGLGAGATVDTGLSAAKSKVIPPSTARSFHKVIYAARYGVVCDGVTVNSTTVTNAIGAGGQKAHVIFPRGTCLVSVEGGTFNVYDGSWYSGAGKLGTIIKRANGGSANNNIFTIASGGGFGATGNVLFTDMTIDGNCVDSSCPNETGGGDSIGGTSPTSKFSALRMRIINSYGYGIGLRLGTGNNADVLVADSDFEGNGLRAGCAAIPCTDITVQAPLRVRVTRNRSASSQGFSVFSGHNGAGALTVSQNNVNACLGFAVALGGGGTNPGPAGISDNTFACPGSSQNTIDMAFWFGIRVENNTITFGGAGIADGPPSNNVQIIGNKLFGVAGNGYCIGPGGNDMLIADNFCTGAGAGGIGVNNGGGTAASKGIVIVNNIVKNSSQFTSGAHSGIELNIAAAGGTFNGVIIKGNKVYDDQETPTQGYGIALATFAPFTGFSNVTIENNDVRRNKTGGILKNATPTTGVVIANNPGGESSYLCQLTACPTPTIGSGTTTTNGTGIAAGASQAPPKKPARKRYATRHYPPR